MLYDQHGHFRFSVCSAVSFYPSSSRLGKCRRASLVCHARRIWCWWLYSRGSRQGECKTDEYIYIYIYPDELTALGVRGNVAALIPAVIAAACQMWMDGLLTDTTSLISLSPPSPHLMHHPDPSPSCLYFTHISHSPQHTTIHNPVTSTSKQKCSHQNTHVYNIG